MKYLIALIIFNYGSAFADISYCQTQAGKYQTFRTMGFIQSKDDDEPFLKVSQSLIAQCKEMESKNTKLKDLTSQLYTNCRELTSANFKSKDSRKKYGAACESAYNAAESYFEGVENGKASCSGNWTKGKGTKVEIDMNEPAKPAPPK